MLVWLSAGLQLRLLTFNRQMRVFGVMEMTLQWDYGGSINAQLQIGAVPLVASSGSARLVSITACSPVAVDLYRLWILVSIF